MRLPFDLNDSKFSDDSRIKFSYNSPEFHQNIEISLDGDETSVEALLDAFQRFLGALGVCFPENAVLGFIELEDFDDEDEEEEDDFDDEDEDDDE